MKAIDKVIVALDNMDRSDINDFLSISKNNFSTYKIGMELFYLYGQNIVNEVYDKTGAEIFLDLKLHDIPNTVKKAITSLKGLPIKFLTIHLAGGENMLKMAQIEAQTSLPKTKLLGVSYLTSLSASDFSANWNMDKFQTERSFKNLFTLAHKANIPGVVLSPFELKLVKEIEDKKDKKFIKVTPGIRFIDEISSNNIQDQKRVKTPKQAIEEGSDWLVMGRSITQAENLLKRIEELKSF